MVIANKFVMKKHFKILLGGGLLVGFLFLLHPVLAQNLGLNAVNNGLGGTLSSADPRAVIGRIINIVLGFLGVVAVGLIIYAGVVWLTSGGDEEKISKAKTILKNSLIGLAIVLASWGIATFVISRLAGATGSNGGGNNGCVGLDCNNNPPCSGLGCNNNPPCSGSIDPNCQPDSGHPVITGLSPVGGFCVNNINKACSSDTDCPASSCDLVTPNGAPSNLITILGKNFGSLASSSKIIFMGSGNAVVGIAPISLNPACKSYWSDNQIIVAVPSGATSGPIKVINAQGTTDTTNDSYGPKFANFVTNQITRPGLCALTPQSGQLSSAVSYSGLHLYSSTAYFGNYKQNVQALRSNFSNSSGLNGTSTVPNIVSGTSGSFVQSLVNGVPESSNALQFVKQGEPNSGPFISSFTPVSGNAGQYVTILGSGFGSSQGSSQVFFGNTEAAYDFPAVCLNSVWSDNKIVVKVPSGLTDGNQIISIKLGSQIISSENLNPNAFKFDKSASLKTSLCRLDPTSGPVGTPVSLWGQYFGPVNSEGLVKFSYDSSVTGNTLASATGTITAAGQADLIKTAVPLGAVTGPVEVINNSIGGNSLDFNVGSCTANSDCGSTQVCCPSNTYKAGRCEQDLSACLTNIPTSVFAWSFTTGFADNKNPTSTDHCSTLSIDQCTSDPSCCLDAKATGGVKCSSGTQIASSSPDKGYCAYYNCSTTDATQCAATTPVKDGQYKSLDACNSDCSAQSKCSDFTNLSSCQADTNCCFDAKNDQCRSGQQIIDGSVSADNGYCAYYNCNASTTVKTSLALVTSKTCATSTPVASGTYSGLNSCIVNCAGDLSKPICGCNKDSDCSIQPTSTGCSATDNCCYDRPQIVSTSPQNLDDKVCRNSLIEVNFNQKMNTASFPTNVLLLQQKDYGNGTCPPGSLALSSQQVAALTRGSSRFQRWLMSHFSWFNQVLPDSALAVQPNPDKLYCSVSGLVHGENHGSSTSLIFMPRSILDGSTTYYLVVKGDQNLNSKTGVLNFRGIGFNGTGFTDVSGIQTDGANIKFNSTSYPHSQIIEFSTLSAQGPMSGICAIDHVSVTPPSYLVHTDTNDFASNEDDTDASGKNFDTVADSDKVFTASAYSADNQILHPVTGYFWNWDFSLDKKVASIVAASNLPPNEVFVRANQGVTDANTKVMATVDMNNFSGSNSVASNCSCSDLTCSNNCTNAYLGGDGFQSAADLYVFICNNPWPPINADGTWYPWQDQSQGLNSPNYNYKFYYCRDAGSGGTLNDLPAINSQPLTVGQSSQKICSSDHSACTNLNSPCGPVNGDGSQSGVCIWSVLKESYFLRAPIPGAPLITSLTDLKTGGAVRLAWQSNANNIADYQIYYLSPGQTSLTVKRLPITPQLCSVSGSTDNCQQIITGLSNNLPYVFEVSALSTDQAESPVSKGVLVTPTDQTPPDVPSGLNASEIGSSTLRFAWNLNSDDAAVYRLYYGVKSGLYGETFEAAATNTLRLPLSDFSIGKAYFALSALDTYNNESLKGVPLQCVLSNIPETTGSPAWVRAVCQ